jgi:tRNA1(Val) A37 N6-methylase TrmN6
MNQKQVFFTAMGGRVKFYFGNYNITSDAVWLAAFVVKAKIKNVLDVGIGTGGVSLCLLEHNPNLEITGIDISKQMLDECEKNAKLNKRKITLLNTDILNWKTSKTFDAVITNPPYFKGSAASHGAHHNVNLAEWTRACLKRVRPRGYFYAIADSSVISEIIAELYNGKAGGIEIIPLFSEKKNTAERVLVSARLGVKTGTKIYSGMLMNDKTILQNGDII